MKTPTQRIRLAIDKALEALPLAPEDGRASTWSSDHQAAGDGMASAGAAILGGLFRLATSRGVESAVVP